MWELRGKNHSKKIISLRCVPKQTERLVREKCPKSLSRGILFHVIGAQ